MKRESRPLIHEKGYIRNIDSVEAQQLATDEQEGKVLGFSWYESPYTEAKPSDQMMLWGIVCMGAPFILMMMFTPLILVGIGIFWPIGIGLMVQSRVRKEPKITELIVNALLFRADGQIRATNPWKAKIEGDEIKVQWDTLKPTVNDVLNISLHPMKANDGSPYKHNRDSKRKPDTGYFAYSVEVDFSTGERFTAGRYLNEGDGRTIAFQLNKALTTIRQESARQVSKGQNPPNEQIPISEQGAMPLQPMRPTPKL